MDNVLEKDNVLQDEQSQPPITVVISTRNRGDEILGAIKSILKNDYPNFELRVVDQSEDDRTAKAIEPYLKDTRFSYMHSDTVGVSLGRNIAICSSSNEFIAITDDDCEVPTDWLSQMVKAFKIDPRIGLVFGNVVDGNHDMRVGFIPTYTRYKPFLARSIKDKNQARGIGACMGLRKSVWEAVHGFDEMLGPGSRLKCAEEGDFTIKVLLSGYYVYETPAINLIHNGFRTWLQGKDLARRNYFGVGAMLAKYIKYKKFFVIPIVVYEIAYVIKTQLVVNSIANRKISGVTPVIYLFKGIWKGLFTPLDFRSGNFYEKGSPPLSSKENAIK